MSEQARQNQESSSQTAALEKAEARPSPEVTCPGGQASEAPAAVPAAGQPRFHRVDRDLTVPARKLDQLIEPDHPARRVRQFTGGLVLSALYGRLRARGHTRGRSPIDPRILVALWLYAILYGVVSARRLAAL